MNDPKCKAWLNSLGLELGLALNRDKIDIYSAVSASMTDAALSTSPDHLPDEHTAGKIDVAAAMLSNLLARIHRDGGHYEAQHGTEKACADADEIVARLYADTVDVAEECARPFAYIVPQDQQPNDVRLCDVLTVRHFGGDEDAFHQACEAHGFEPLFRRARFGRPA